MLSSILPFVVAGIATGAILGLAGTGLVLTYKTTGIFNFGHGAVAAAAAFIFYYLHVSHGWQWWEAFLVVVGVVGPVFGLVLEQVGKRVSTQRTSMKIVATVGIILLVYGLATAKYGYNTTLLPQYLPHGNETIEVDGVFITWAQIIITGFAIIVVAILFTFFRVSRTGLAMRAVVDDPELVRLHGTSSTKVQRNAWVIGATLAAMSGVLIAPITGVQAETLTYLVVEAFAAAALGAFSSLPITFIGGLVVGVATSVATKYVITSTSLTGLPTALPFIILVAVLLVVPKRKLVSPSSVEKRVALSWKAPPRLAFGSAMVVVVLLALVPSLVGVNLQYYTIGLTQAMVLLSLGLLVRTGGMVSLCQSIFAAIGGAAFAQIMAHTALPWGVAAILGALIVVPIAALVALPAIRLSGLFLGLATFGFALTVEALFYPQSWFFTQGSSGLAMPRPDLFKSDKSFYYLVLALFLIVSIGMILIHRSRLGRTLRGLSESPLAMDTLGLNVNLTRIIVFCIAGFVAGLAGVLYGADVHFAVIGDQYYSSFYSLVLVAILAVSPGREPWYAVVAGVSAVIPAYWHVHDVSAWLDAIFGFFAIAVAMRGGAQTMPAFIRRWAERIEPPRLVPVVAAVAVEAHLAGSVIVGPDLATPAPAHAAPRAGLEIRDLTVTFGGLVAVDGLSLAAPLGQITGLIGPNGAGKTTTFNAASGLVRPASGSILLHGSDVTKLAPNARGRMGLGRTFQLMQLSDSLTVAENVALGAEASYAGSNLRGQIVASRNEARQTRKAVQEALKICGIEQFSEIQVGALSTGQRRLVELARCLTGEFDVLLLDEPSSGLDPLETDHFARILALAIQERGLGILLVEHDMALVLGICREIFVMDFGKFLFRGTPEEVRRSEIVQSAYLGSSASEPEPSSNGGVA